MYDGALNEGMRGIRQLIEAFEVNFHMPLKYEVFDVRGKSEVPDLEYDLYISTGGPGSPLDSEGSLWERRYFTLIEKILEHNRTNPQHKKHVLLICHSFQLFCRYYKFAKVSKRKSTLHLVSCLYIKQLMVIMIHCYGRWVILFGRSTPETIKSPNQI